ncbi:hypothetical protein SAMN05661096_03821 [Marivirga sericea]|uniref:Uncharacterized protein n=1 Tax=Marivirga sericea TaxID=1028 RepID=A0A1X7LDP5_9BACT|nr:hypothetical protein [Marivirga sericea]SMG51820.1 hypothetical protein SAMN05661096_03821 [Marivirga sericea]
MNDGIIKNAYEAMIKELQTIITLAYIFAVGVGMLFNYQRYDEFGINIFDYADVFDFLITPFSDLHVLLFTIISLLLTYLVFKLDEAWKTRYPKWYSRINFGYDRKTGYANFRYLSIAALLICYLYLSADWYGAISKKQLKRLDPITIQFSDGEVKKGKMIGKTKEVIFLMDGKHVEVIPISSLVKTIKIPVP